MSNLADLATIAPFEVWGAAVRARKVEGDQVTLAVVELAPDAVVPEHTHASEQLGIVIRGSMRFTVAGETRELGPGGTWRILSGRPHDAVAGPEGAVVIDAFAPIRSDWDFPFVAPEPPIWPTEAD